MTIAQATALANRTFTAIDAADSKLHDGYDADRERVEDDLASYVRAEQARDRMLDRAEHWDRDVRFAEETSSAALRGLLRTAKQYGVTQ